MKAIKYDAHGGYDVLRLVETEEPSLRSGEVLVEMLAAGVNQGDNVLRLGYWPGSKLPLIPGFEGVGRIIDSGDTAFSKGERVMFTGEFGISRDGTWRERMAVPAELCVRVPDKMADEEAAGFPIAYLTAFLSLEAGGFSPGMRVLVPAAGGGVGNAAVQLAKARGAAQVITTTGSAQKAKKARELGYENVIDLSSESLAKKTREFTSGAGVDLVIDGIGGEVTKECLSVLAPGGKHVMYGAAAGGTTTIDAFSLIVPGASLIGFAALPGQPAAARERAYREMLPLIEDGKIRPVVYKAFALSDAKEAQRCLIEDRPFGKVVIGL